MPKPRSSGASSSIRRSSSQIEPPVSGSSPARQFRAVDLPQPDGPSRAMNSPRWTVRDTSFSAFRVPKCRLMPSRRSERESREALAIGNPPPILADAGADLLVPTLEGVDQSVGGQRGFGRHVGDQLVIEVAVVFL